MTLPTATYRLQFRNGMTLDRAAEFLPYLAELGISHVYASPLFAAAPGSQHGYDGVDFSVIDPVIGGEDGLERLTGALDQAGIGLIVDFVPNHMAAREENPWWFSVLEWGRDSPEARVFDIDWTAPKLLLPILGSTFDAELSHGAIGLEFQAASGAFAFSYYDRRFPLTPASYSLLLARSSDSALTALASEFKTCTVDDAPDLKRHLAQLAQSPGCRAAIGGMLDNARGSPDFLRTLHDRQVWRLEDWRRGREELTYRRFFEIADLVCVREEDATVFRDVHRRLFELIRAGQVSGLRIDHIDGLADPKAYLEELQAELGTQRPFYVLVEKILADDEDLRPDWPVAGTTGYEFISALAALFVDARKEPEMTDAYVAFTSESIDYGALALAAKRDIFAYNLAAELDFLVRAAETLAGEQPDGPGREALHYAIVEIAAHLPVYRTYIDTEGPSDDDRVLVANAHRGAAASASPRQIVACDFVRDLLLLDVEPALREEALAFTVRFQQTTGPVMAKAIEDTLFYRFNRLIALNEVGGEPSRYGETAEDFHASMTKRRGWAEGLSATATHDTKRGEDARARLYALSEIPETWARAVSRWAELNAVHRVQLPSGPAPDPAIEWAFYQALLGVWPTDLIGRDGAGGLGPGLADLRARMDGYMRKAAREAKSRTSWTDPDADYETAVSKFVETVLTEEGPGTFLADFQRTCAPIWAAGAINGLAQLVLKLMAPGVPDIYQGTELWDYSLVDPDNRAPVDFAARQELLRFVAEASPEELLADWRTGAPKLALMAAGLRLRGKLPRLFADGDYEPLAAHGKASGNVVGFCRRFAADAALAIVPRFVLELSPELETPELEADLWQDTMIRLPGAEVRHLTDVLTGETFEPGATVPVSEVLARFPVALLSAGVSD